MRWLVISVLICGIAALSGCVSTETHKATLEELDSTQASLDAAQQEIENKQRELDRTRLQLDNAHNELIGLEIKKQDLQNALQESSEQLGMLREVEAETNRRNEIYAQFVQRLQHMIDVGQLTVNIEKGRIVINLPDNVLFQSGSAMLNQSGTAALRQIAGVLAQFEDRRFQVEGHTDDRPINSARFPSNWELSAARALAVVHLLADAGVPSRNLSAAGFGEYQPRADNGTPEGRQLNRRIEIVMLPNLDVLSDELPKVSQ